MANNYSQFSEGFDVTEEEAKWINDFLCAECPHPDEEPEKYKSWCEERTLKEGDDPDYFPGFQYDLENKDSTFLWLYAAEGCDTDYLATFVQAFLKKFRPKDVLTFTGASYCSKLRLGEFGGWWLAVSANEIAAGNTWDDARDVAKLMVKKLGATKKGKK